MVSHERTESGADRLWTERGEVQVREPTRGVIVVEYRGSVDVEFALPIIDAVSRRFLPDGQVEMFIDTERLLSNDSTFRKKITEATNQNAARFSRIHCLVKSKLIAMSLTMVNLATNNSMKIYSNRATFAAELNAAVRKLAGHTQKNGS